MKQQPDTDLLQEKLGRAIEYIKELSQENAILTERLEIHQAQESSSDNAARESELEAWRNRVALLTQKLEAKDEQERKLQNDIDSLNLKLQQDTQPIIHHTAPVDRATDYTFALLVLEALFREAISSLDIPLDQRQPFLDFQIKFQKCVSNGEQASTLSNSSTWI